MQVRRQVREKEDKTEEITVNDHDEEMQKKIDKEKRKVKKSQNKIRYTNAYIPMRFSRVVAEAGGSVLIIKSVERENAKRRGGLETSWRGHKKSHNADTHKAYVIKKHIWEW